MATKIYGYHIIFTPQNKIVYVGIGNKERTKVLKRNKHFNKFAEEQGWENFECVIVAEFPNAGKAKAWEDRQMLEHNTLYPEGYNLVTSNYGWTNEVRKKKSENTKKQWQDDEFKQMMSKKSSKCLKKLWQDDEFKHMMSEISKKRWQDDDYRQNISDKSKKMWEDENHRKIISEHSKKLWQDDDYRAKIVSPAWKHIKEIVDDYLKGLTKVKIGKKFNISQPTVSKILSSEKAQELINRASEAA